MNASNFRLTQFECGFVGCHFRFNDMFLYSRHLYTHDVPVNIMRLSFKSKQDFKKWMYDEQCRNNCMFTSTQAGTFFPCHRSYFAARYGAKRREPYWYAAEGYPYKITSPCPSHIKFTITRGGIYHVLYVRTHIGLCCELKNTAISNETVRMVKSLYRNQVDCKLIIEKVRAKFKNKNETDYLITMTQLKEILHLA